MVEATVSAEQDRAVFLDGIRGWASLMVLFSHLVVFFLANTIPELKPWIFGIATDGNLAIFIFFVLSGFVLSIGYVQTGKRGIITALAIRRYARLAIPIVCTVFFAYLLLEFDLFYNIEAGNLSSNTWISGFYTFSPDLLNSMKFALYGVFTYWDGALSYNPVLWTMSIELWGSFVVFSICALVLNLRKRMLILVFILIYLYAVNNIYYLPFVCGICIAIFHHQPNKKIAKYVSFLSPIILGLVVYYSCSTMRGGIFGLPAMPRNDTLNILVATAVVFVASCTPLVRNFFQNRLSRYLGSISFPLYLTHFLVLCSFSSFMLIKLQKMGFSPERSNVINCFASLFICILTAHLFRYIESFAIRTARKLSDLIMSEQRLSLSVFPLVEIVRPEAGNPAPRAVT